MLPRCIKPIGTDVINILGHQQQALDKRLESIAAMTAPKPRPGIFDIQAYVPGDSEIAGNGKVIKLSSNETPLGPSLHAMEAYRQASDSLERYPDGQATRLRTAIGASAGLDPSQIVCGAGSDELLNLLAQAYLGPGDEAIYTTHGFLVYRIAILANGATPVIASETNLTADVDTILACVTGRTRVVFLANPNNPTGTYLPSKEVYRLREALPQSVLLVLDAAYAEYVDRDDYEAGAALVNETDNTVMTRTFSKIYGLAALRIGWCYCPPNIADVLNRIRGPFNLTSSAIAAGAAAITDDAHRSAAAAHNTKWRDWISRELTSLGLAVTPSVGNFVLIGFDRAVSETASKADDFLKSNGIILRRVDGYGLPNCLRLTIGLEKENIAVRDALKDFMERPNS